MKKLQGEPIEFSLEFEPGENPEITGFNGFEDLFMYLYTDSCYVCKFSMNETEGFETLDLSEDNQTLTGLCVPDDTKLFSPGALMYEVICKLSDTNNEKKGLTGISISQALIKCEA